MSFPVGLTDGLGNVYTGPEEDEEDSFLQTVGNAVSTQYQITPEGGGNYVPPAPDSGGSFFDEGIAPPAPAPSYEPWDEGIAPPVPAAPQIQSGSQFFGNNDVGFTEDGAGGSEAFMPTTNYVSNEDFFGSVGSADPFGVGFTEQGPGDTLSSGFDVWLDNQINQAITNNDQQQYSNLIALFGQQGEGPPDLNLRGAMDQFGTPMVDTPYGPMYYTDAERRMREDMLSGQSRALPGMDRADAMGVFPQFDDFRNAQMGADRFFQLPNQFGGQYGDPFASGQQADYRDFALSQGDLRFDTGDNRFATGLGYLATGLGAGLYGANEVRKFIASTPAIGDDITIGETASALWDAYNYTVSKTAQGLMYGDYTLDYATSRLTGQRSRDTSGAYPLEGESYQDFIRRKYEANGLKRFTYETVFDPTNFVGAGEIARAADAVTVGRRLTRTRQAIAEGVEGGWIPEQLVDDFLKTRPSSDVTNKISWGYDSVAGRLISQTGIPVEDVANQAIAQRLVMEYHLASRGIDNRDLVAVDRSLEQVRTRVIGEVAQQVEQQYGTKVANQVVRQLNTPQVQQALNVIASPNVIPLPTNQVVILNPQGTQITGIYAPGSGQQVFATPGATPARVSQYSGTAMQTLTTPRVTFAPGSGRNVLPTGLTRRPDATIVTVSRQVADDVLQSSVSAGKAVDDAIAVADQLTLPAAPVDSVDTTVVDLLPPAPPQQAVGVPLDMSVSQQKRLDYFSRRDGVNYADEIIAAGDTSRQAVDAKLAELTNSGLATPDQIVRLGQLGVLPSDQAEWARRTAREVQDEIRRLEVVAPRPVVVMTASDYTRQFPDVATRPYTEETAIIAAKRSKTHGWDFLKKALDEGWDEDRLKAAISADNLPASVAQRENVRRLQREGKVSPSVNPDALTIETANHTITRAMNTQPITAWIQHNAPTPLRVEDATDTALSEASRLRIEAQKKGGDYLKRHIPQFSGGQWVPPGYKRGIKGQPVTDLGVAVHSPLAFRQWATDVMDSGALKGTIYEDVVDELARSVLHVSSAGKGRFVLSSDTVSEHFAYLTRQLAEMALWAEPDDTRRLIDALDASYNGDRYANITRDAGKLAKIDDAEKARRVDQARSMLPTVRADLRAVTAKLNKHHTDTLRLADRDLQAAQATKAKLEEQEGRLLDLTNPKGKDAPALDTKRQQRQTQREESSAKARQYAPTIGENPPVESDQSLAGLASDHDIQHQLLNNLVPEQPEQVVIRSQPGGDGELPSWFNEGLRPADRTIQQTVDAQRSRLAVKRYDADQRLLDLQERAAKGGRVSQQSFEKAQQEIDELSARLRELYRIEQSVKPTMAEVEQRKLAAAEAWIADNPEMAAEARVLFERGGSQYDLPRRIARTFRASKTDSTALWQAFKQRGSDVAAGGGLGIMPPAAQRLYALMQKPQKLPNLIEPNVHAWRNADWDKIGPELDAWGKQFYDVDWILNSDNVLKLGNVELNPVALKKSARVAQAGDRVDAAFARWLDDAQQADDPYAFMYNLLDHWTKDDLSVIGKSDRFFVTSTTGQEALRLIKRTGEAVIRDWQAILPEGDVYDVRQLANRIGTRVSEEYAKIIGFNPDSIPAYARPMMWVKAQLTPLWMTTVPSYHLNNIAGNWMAQIIQAAFGRGHTSAFKGIVNGQYFDEAETGFSYPRWITDAGQGRSQFTETAVAAADRNVAGKHRPAILKVGRKRIVGNTADIIDKATLGRQGSKWQGLATFGEDTGDFFETAFKKIIYTQEVWGEYPKLWRGELDQMLRNGDLTTDQVNDLVMAKGLREVREQANGLPVLDELLSRQRSVIGASQDRAYRIASGALRDYRMRNKIDGFMDQFLPVHFWATKNMLFVGKSALNRPALAVSAGQAYNAFAAEHKDDPLSVAAGYLKLPAELASHVPFMGDGAEYWMRLTQITNPIFFAVPKLVAAMNRDYQLQPDDTSLWDRVQYWGKSGLANFWEAAGYRLGPQWDYAIKAANRIDKNPDGKDADILFAANFLTAPYTDRQGKRRPGQQSVVPLGGWETVFSKLGIPGTETGISVEAGVRWLNQAALGSPYTNYEIAQAALWMKEDTYVHWSPENQARLDQALAAMGSGNYDDPYVKQALDRVWDNSGEGFIRNRLLGISGREWTETNERVADAWDYYNARVKEGKENGPTPSYLLEGLPAELRWMIRDSGATDAEIRAAIAAGKDGKDHALLKRAREATGTEEWALADQQEFARTIFAWGAAYDKLVEQRGEDYAKDKIFGTYNTQTGQREGGLAPGMEALFMSSSPDRMAEKANKNIANRNWQALTDMYWAGEMEENHKAFPYYQKLAKADEALRTQVAQANGDMRLVDLAFKAHTTITGRIYDEAQANGLDMGPSGRIPSQGQNYYTRTQEEKNFLEWNGALEAVEGRERAQARQGFVLGIIAEQLGVKKYTEDGEFNPAFVDADGRFDDEKYQAALVEASQQAPGLFNQIVLDLRDLGSYIEMGVGNKGIKPADFLYHMGSKNPELDAWREQKQAAIDAYYDMPGFEDGDTDEERNAKVIEGDRLKSLYGEEVLDKTYRDSLGRDSNMTGKSGKVQGPVLVSAEDHRRYDEDIRAAEAWYRTLSPADKLAVKEQYPDAFGDKDGTFVTEDGEEVKYDQFHGDRLTSEQANEIVQSNGLDSSPNRGDRADRIQQQRGTPEQQQTRMDADLVYIKKDEFDHALPEDLQMQLEMQQAHKDSEGQQLITLDGQEMTFEEAAQMLIEDPRAVGKNGYASWFGAAKIVGQDTPLGQYMLEKKRLSDEAKPAKAAQDAWWNQQTDEVKQILLAEDPKGFEWLAKRAGDIEPTSTSGTPAATTSGGGGGYSSNYRPYTSTYRPYSSSSSRGGGSSYRGGGGGFGYSSGAGGDEQPVLNSVLALDPFLSSGQDDGRRAIAQQVSDHIQRLVTGFTMFAPDRQQGQMFAALWMQLLARKLGPNPDMNSWMQLLAWLTRRQQQPATPAQNPNEPPARIAEAQPAQIPQGLGGY